MVWQLPRTLRTHSGGRDPLCDHFSDDIAAVHKNSTSLVFDGFIKDVMVTMNARPMTVEKLYHKPQEHTMTLAELDQNPSAKHSIGLTHDHYLTQLSPGQHLESLKDGFLHYLDLAVRLEQLHGEGILSESPKAQKVSLLHLCRDIIVKCNTNILFGKRLLEIDPGLPKTFCTFDDDHRMMLYEVPRLPARLVHSSQQKIKDDFIRYLDIPTLERPGEAWLIRKMEDGMRAGIDEEEMATQFLLVYWSCTWTRKPLAPQPHPSTQSGSSETKPWPVVQAIGLLAEARRSVRDVFLPNRRFLMFVAMVLWQFDIKVAEGDRETKISGFPEPEDRNPPIGVMGPIRGEDVLIEMRAAKR